MVALIPMMGLGERFHKDGYSEYKPFVRINTKLLIEKVIEPLEDHFDSIYIVCNDYTEKYLTTIFGSRVVIIKLESQTRGAAETVLKAVNHLPANTPIACIDCDTIFQSSALEKLVNVKQCATLTFEDVDKSGIYSYVNVDVDGFITDVQEKIAISTKANAGVYVFENRDVLEYCCKIPNNSEGELYLSGAIRNALQHGIQFKAIDVSNQFHCCGTPFQLKTYAKEHILPSKYTICFDIDRTLVYDLYTNPIGIEKNIKFCNEAYKAGCTIILQTARGMLSKNGDAEKIEAQRPHIIRVLQEAGVLYHQLVLMKPYADLYVDDKAISAYRDLEKDTGLYLFEDHSPRSHNKIIVDGGTIRKIGNLSGEAYYYNNIPEQLQSLFPKAYSVSDSMIELEKLTGPTYSSLLVAQRLTKADIDTLLECIARVHRSTSDHKQIATGWAYKEKVLERLEKHPTLYETLNINTDYYTKLCHTNIETQYGRIHGDPVFTNIFLDTRSKQCMFIDMRGSWNSTTTVGGDIGYDYAKILQSLYGYDYALHNEPVEQIYLSMLRDHFLDRITYYDPTIIISELITKTKLLLVSAMPFHKEDLDRCKRFVNILDSM